MEETLSKKTSLKKFSNRQIGDNDEHYIHFNDKDELEKFIKYGNKFKIVIGHKCCNDKGCMLKEFNGNKINNYNEIHDIYRTFQQDPPPLQ